jgi:hypothetical protein
LLTEEEYEYIQKVKFTIFVFKYSETNLWISEYIWIFTLQWTVFLIYITMLLCGIKWSWVIRPSLIFIKIEFQQQWFFSGSFICLKMIAKMEIFKKGGKCLNWAPQNFVCSRNNMMWVLWTYISGCLAQCKINQLHPIAMSRENVQTDCLTG